MNLNAVIFFFSQKSSLLDYPILESNMASVMLELKYSEDEIEVQVSYFVFHELFF